MRTLFPGYSSVTSQNPNDASFRGSKHESDFDMAMLQLDLVQVNYMAKIVAFACAHCGYLHQYLGLNSAP